MKRLALLLLCLLSLDAAPADAAPVIAVARPVISAAPTARLVAVRRPRRGPRRPARPRRRGPIRRIFGRVLGR